MQVQGLVWVGTRTAAFRETVRFFQETLEIPFGKERPGFVRLDLPAGGFVEVFDAATGEYPHFSTGPVPGFQVSDFDRARSELERLGYELLLPPGGDPGDYRWQHFRGPDGSVYEVVVYPRRPAPRPPAGTLGVTGFVWLGVSTAAFGRTSQFLRETLNLRVVEATDDLLECATPDGSGVEVFRRDGSQDHPHFRTGPVVGFGVRDIDRTTEILRERGVPILQTRRRDGGGWTHLRAPDGHVYEVKQAAGPAGE